MSKLVCITKPIEELKEGVNELEVGQICPDEHKPTPYPGTISMPCDQDVISVKDCEENGVKIYLADVEVSFDEDKNPSFKLVSIKRKKDITKDPKYLEHQEAKRAEEYARLTDKLVIEKMRKQLKDPDIDAIVEDIKKRFPK